MALDKSRTPTWMKVLLIIMAAAFVLSIVALPSAGLFGSSGQDTPATSPMEQAAASHAANAAAFDDALASEPTSYTLLVGAGNTYFDWAAEVQTSATATSTLAGADRPMWIVAADYYARALKAKPGDPNVSTDYAIALFYSGRTDDAIKVVAAVLETDPEFAPALFNLGIFYSDAERPADAAAAMQRYLAADPNGQFGNAETAQSIIAQASGPASRATTGE